jgi:hypothetical protein
LCYSNNRSVGTPDRPTAQQLRNLANRSLDEAVPIPILMAPHVDVELKILSIKTGESLLKKSYRLSIYRHDMTDFVCEELT